MLPTDARQVVSSRGVVQLKLLNVGGVSGANGTGSSGAPHSPSGPQSASTLQAAEQHVPSSMSSPVLARVKGLQAQSSLLKHSMSSRQGAHLPRLALKRASRSQIEAPPAWPAEPALAPTSSGSCAGLILRGAPCLCHRLARFGSCENHRSRVVLQTRAQQSPIPGTSLPRPTAPTSTALDERRLELYTRPLRRTRNANAPHFMRVSLD
jgi:hypothetical protein